MSAAETEIVPVAKRFDHIGIVVSNLEGSREWCREILDAIPVGDPFEVPGTGVRLAFVSLGNGAIELIEHAGTPGRPFELANNDPGAFHPCLRVSDLDAPYRRLLDHGGSASTPPTELIPDVFSYYFRDPDRVQFQLIKLPGPAGEEVGLRFADGLHHVAFSVADLDRTLEWYERVLGLRRLPPPKEASGQGAPRGGDLVSRTFEVPAGEFRQALVPIGGGASSPGGILLEIMEWVQPRGRPYSLTTQDIGSAHLCFEVDDLDTVHNALASGGERILAPLSAVPVGPLTGRRSFFVGDPDGLPLQILGAPKPSYAAAVSSSVVK